MRGTQVKDLSQLQYAAKHRIKVCSSKLTKPLPAAFGINFRGGKLFELMRDGLWFYVKGWN